MDVFVVVGLVCKCGFIIMMFSYRMTLLIVCIARLIYGLCIKM